MSQGRIARSHRRHSTVQRRAQRYNGSLAARRGASLPPHLLTGITRKKSSGNRLKWALIGAQFVILLGLLGMTAFVVSAIAGVSGTMAAYREVNKGLPDAGKVSADTFQSTRILDRDGNLLQEVDDPDYGWRTFVPLEQVSQYAIDATVAAEDATFWSHRGVEPIAIARGIAINMTGAGSSGASTITQQLVRSLFPNDISSLDISYSRKGKEALAAVAIERTYSKHDILSMYVNLIFYGQRSYGIEAAAQTYFNKHASELNLAEASMLAGLPQQPTGYNPLLYFEQAKDRQRYVLDQMVKHRYVTRAEADAAWLEPLQPQLRPERDSRIYDSPHFVTYAREYIVEHYGEEALYRGGLTITTTLDPELQERAEEIVFNQVQQLAPYNASNAAAVVMVPWSGEVLAMVGSANFNDPVIQGEVNIATSDQQPGSAIKPLVYAAAFEAGWNPGTVVLDTTYRRRTPDGPDPFYEPNNYTGQFFGAVPVRIALANSLNIPALKAVEYVGVDKFIDFAHQVGFAGSLNEDPSFYGSAIALGAGEVEPIELTNAYGTLANNGKYVPANPILKIEDSQGNVLYEQKRDEVLAKAKQVIEPEHAYQVTSILTDNRARAMIFTENNLFGETQTTLGRPTAAKSGTSNEWRDIWTMGYTTDTVIGVWVGNTNNEALAEIDGIQGAGPIWQQLMYELHQDASYADLLVGPNGQPMPEEFPRPDGIYEGPVCAATGHKPTQNSGNRSELLARGEGPTLRCDQLSAWERAELAVALQDVRVNAGKYASGGVSSVQRYADAVGYSGRGGGAGGSANNPTYFGYRPPYETGDGTSP